jgi:uncharacterized SAM-binding protein YcdF (DUF218 family)
VNPFKRTLYVISLPIFVWLTGFAAFILTLPNRVEDEDTHTDAIVVLTGGSERINTGLTLLDHEMADRMFVSGVHKGVEIGDILRASHAEAPLEITSRITLGHLADDTVGKAEETKDWVRVNNIKSIRLVTASYHMRRSLWEFQRTMPDVALIPHPVFPDHAKAGQGGYVLLLAGEYSKYAIALVRNTVVKKGDQS